MFAGSLEKTKKMLCQQAPLNVDLKSKEKRT